MTEVRFKTHSTKQESLIFSDAELTIAGTGTQWGKSQGGALWMKRQIHKHRDPSSTFLIGAPTYKILQQSTLPYFLSIAAGMGEYNKAEAVFNFHHGPRCFFRTETDPDSIVGIPNLKAFWLDEAGKLRLYFWENVQARQAAVGAVGLLSTSPYAMNWLYQDFIKPLKAGKDIGNVVLIQAASWENPFHTLHDPARRKEMQARMDPRRFAMVFGGEWGQMVGLVYDCWDDAENLIRPFPLPTGTRYFGGVDWGYYPDPFVLKIRAITPDGQHYGISEFVKTRLTPADQILLAKQKMEVFGIERFLCDPSEPGLIEEWNRAGLPAVGADNDISRGVGIHYELIKTRRYKEFIGQCPYSYDERQTYHYPEPKDLKPDQASKELKPVDQNNHTQDADRYISIETVRSELKHSPKVPGAEFTQPKTAQQRIERLRRTRSGDYPGAERFS